MFTVIGVLKYGGTKCWERTNRKDSLLYVVLLVEENTNNCVKTRNFAKRSGINFTAFFE